MKTIIGWLKRLTTRIVALENAVLSGVPVVISTTGTTTITAEQAFANVHVLNTGAAGEVIFALPPAEVGMRVTATVTTAQLLSLDPVDTEIITNLAGVALTEGAAIKGNAIGEWITLLCTTAGRWRAVAGTGTWTATAA